MPEPLSQSEQEQVFRLATASLLHRYAEQCKTGMTDTELKTALKSCLGIFGGSGGPDRLSVSHQGAGLKIWGGKHDINHVTDPPLFAGNQTINKAREVYNIPDPDNKQLNLF